MLPGSHFCWGNGLYFCGGASRSHPIDSRPSHPLPSEQGRSLRWQSGTTLSCSSGVYSGFASPSRSSARLCRCRVGLDGSRWEFLHRMCPVCTRRLATHTLPFGEGTCLVWRICALESRLQTEKKPKMAGLYLTGRRLVPRWVACTQCRNPPSVGFAQGRARHRPCLTAPCRSCRPFVVGRSQQGASIFPSTGCAHQPPGIGAGWATPMVWPRSLASHCKSCAVGHWVGQALRPQGSGGSSAPGGASTE